MLLQYALTADAGALPPQNGADNGDSAVSGEVNESFLGVLGQLELDETVSPHGHVPATERTGEAPVEYIVISF